MYNTDSLGLAEANRSTPNGWYAECRMQNAKCRIFSKFSILPILPILPNLPKFSNFLNYSLLSKFFKKNSCFSSLISPLFCIFVRTKTSDYGKYGENLLRQ